MLSLLCVCVCFHCLGLIVVRGLSVVVCCFVVCCSLPCIGCCLVLVGWCSTRVVRCVCLMRVFDVCSFVFAHCVLLFECLLVGVVC